MMATFTAAAVQSAFADIAMDLHVSIQMASYMTSIVIAVLGGAPLFWRPIANRFGRRPIFLVSLVFSLVGNIGCANSPTYNTMALCRAITAFFISPAAAIGSAVVSETFFRHQRARYMGVWTVMVTIGVPIAPFIMGFVALRVNYRWIYYILAIVSPSHAFTSALLNYYQVNAVQFILYFFLGSESLYMRGSAASMNPNPSKSLFNFRRIDPTPISPLDFVRPLRFFAKPRVLIPAVAYSMVFLLAGILITIEIPQLFVEQFHFNTQQIGLQNLSIIIGSLIGEYVGGFMSDVWMTRKQRQSEGRRPSSEYRLWLAYPGYLLAICGVIVFIVQTKNAGEHWNITPLVGAAIASAGNQIVTTVLITYAVDNYREDAASVGVFITFVRQIWGFIGPFW